jgi:hypothetical protein
MYVTPSQQVAARLRLKLDLELGQHRSESETQMLVAVANAPRAAANGRPPQHGERRS